MLDKATVMNPFPAWWQADQNNGWDRVKVALHRDWEQTKSDFSGGRDGEDLNQNIGDTVRQALGNGPMPAESAPNPMTPHETAQHVRRAARQMARAADRFDDAAEKSIEKKETYGGLRRWDRWEDAEAPLRYGHAAASHYPQAWNTDTEMLLQSEWGGLYPDREWDEVRDTVREGWERGRL